MEVSANSAGSDDMVVTESINAILSGLDSSESSRLRGAAEEITLDRGALVADAGQAAPYVYFPLEGVLSLVGATSGGATVEVAVVGNEGVASVSAILGKNWMPFRVVTQVPGRALKVPTDVVSKMIIECGGFHRRM